MADKTKNTDENENAGIAEGTEEPKQTPEIDSKYRMILLAAQRSKQLQRGANPRVVADTKKTKFTRIALQEIRDKKVHFRILEEE